MTREEEIAAAFYDYRDALKLTTFGDFEYIDIQGAFEKGAEWADEHPINMWHDANEEPRLNQWFLAQIGDNAFDTFVMEMNKNEDWKEWSNGVNIKRWAYIKDLLPKGGEK